MKMPAVLDQDDRRTLGKLLIYAVLLVCVLVVVALALGFAVRLFLLAKGA